MQTIVAGDAACGIIGRRDLDRKQIVRLKLRRNYVVTA